MKLLTKILILLSFLAVSVNAITLAWDFNDPKEGITSYILYEIKGTNYVKVATVPGTTNSVTIPTQDGFHKYTLTASNAWGESPFSATAEYHGASMVQGVKISK